MLFSDRTKISLLQSTQQQANSLTQSSGLLARLEASLHAGPDWIRDDPQIAGLIQEAVTCMGNFPAGVFTYSNVHPMASRARLLPKSWFEDTVGEVHCTSFWGYIRELANLTIALDKKVHRE